MARSGADLDAVVSFHGVLATKSPAEKGRVRARVLVLTGADDPMIPGEQVEAFKSEMTAADAKFEVISYPHAKHSFTNPVSDSLNMPGIGYNKTVDERSWKAMAAFFEEIFAS